MRQVADQSYVLVDDANCEDICNYLGTESMLAMDTETYHNGKASAPGLIARGIQFTDPYTNNIRLVQIRPRDDGAYLFDLKALSETSRAHVAALLGSETVTWLGYNLKFDYKMIAVNLGVRLPKIYDLMLSAIAIGYATGDTALKARGFSLLDTTRDYLGIYLNKDEQKSNWGAETLTASQLQYAANDLRDLFDLYDVLHKAIVEDFNMEGGVQLEHDVLPFVADIELNGIGFDVALYHRVRAAAMAELPKLEEELCVFLDLDMIVVPPLEAAMTGRTVKPKPRNFNGASANPLTSVQFVVKAFNRKGVPLVNAEADHIESLSHQFPILKAYLRYKDLTKQLSTDYLQWINPQTLCIHPEFDQSGATTGRFSGRNPNLQNVSRFDLICLLTGEEINFRQCFVSPNVHLMPNFASTDYTGQEVSAMVVISQEPVLINILNQPKLIERDGEMVKNMANDVHAKTAELMFGKEFGVTCWNAKKMKHPTIGKPFRDVAKVIVFGLCLAEGTLVSTTRGLVPIEQVQVGDSVYTDKDVRRVDTFQDNGVRETIKLTLSNGQQLEVTPDHRIRVINEAGEYVWKEAQDILPCDYVAIKPNTPSKAGEANCSLDFARYLGYMVSEGSLSTVKYGVTLTQVLGPIADDMLRVSKAVWGDWVHATLVQRPPYQDQQLIQMSRKDIHTKLLALGLTTSAQTKTIPSLIFTASADAQKAFVSALFSGDGSVSRNGAQALVVRYSTSSEQLARQLQILLLSLGHQSSIKSETRAGYDGTYWELRLACGKTFLQDIPILGKSEGLDLDPFIDLTFLPNQQQRLKVLQPKVLAKLDQTRIINGAVYSRTVKEKLYECIRPTNPVRLNRVRTELLLAETHLAELPEYKAIQELHHMELGFAQVVGVESSSAHVYDIGVDTEHCFVANGVVVHNCYGKTSIGLAQDWNITEDEAEAIVKRFFEPYPVLKRELDKLGKFSADTSLSIYGYGTCLRVRMVKSERHSDKGAAERAGKNTPIQGISALMMKRAIVEVGKRLRELEKTHGRLAIMVGTVHDELMTCFADSIREVALKAIADGMQAGGDFYLRNIVPAGSETAVGKTWTKG